MNWNEKLKTIANTKDNSAEYEAADPFYEKGNIDYLERKIKEYRNGILKTEEHELIEDK